MRASNSEGAVTASAHQMKLLQGMGDAEREYSAMSVAITHPHPQRAKAHREAIGIP